MDGADWQVSVYEDGAYSGEMSKLASSYGDRWIRGYHIGVKGHPLESGTSPCWHQYSYRLKNPVGESRSARHRRIREHLYSKCHYGVERLHRRVGLTSNPETDIP